jgi:ArsR family transcriptional regulator, arsenate/arsenite/antimonite-responsive transcriptional repressor
VDADEEHVGPVCHELPSRPLPGASTAIDTESLPCSSIRVNIQLVKTIATVTATCPPVLAGALEQADAESLARALRVLADPARLRILSLLQAQPSGEACVCHLTEPLGLTQPTVSHHLKVLLDAGLVERERRGSWAYFRVVPAELAALRDLLT